MGPFKDVTFTEVATGIAFARDKYPFHVELYPLTVFRVANSAGRKLHAGEKLPSAVRHALQGNLAKDSQQGTQRYAAYRSAVAKIFSDREKASRAAAIAGTLIEEGPSPQATSAYEAYLEQEEPKQMKFNFSRLSGKADP